jgi:hypothetical protein
MRREEKRREVKRRASAGRASEKRFILVERTKFSGFEGFHIVPTLSCG